MNISEGNLYRQAISPNEHLRSSYWKLARTAAGIRLVKGSFEKTRGNRKSYLNMASFSPDQELTRSWPQPFYSNYPELGLGVAPFYIMWHKG